jgi:hypothetical protein
MRLALHKCLCFVSGFAGLRVVVCAPWMSRAGNPGALVFACGRASRAGHSLPALLRRPLSSAIVPFYVLVRRAV